MAREWSDVQPSAVPMVDGASRVQPQADDVSLSDLWSSHGRPQRAYADRARRGHAPPSPRAHRVRAAGPPARRAALAGRVAARAAARPVAVAAAAASILSGEGQPPHTRGGPGSVGGVTRSFP